MTTEVPSANPIADVKRRADIQGLRAVAVLAVLIFHADMPLPGGFLGVDVFLVISGYVITQVVLRQAAESGGVSWTNFYTRRFLRLGPALSVMLVVTLGASFLLSSPFGIQQATGATAIGATLVSANFILADLTGDYFAAPAKFNPLLHTWSLSVEEQTYLLVPLLIVILGMAFKWHTKRALIWTFAGTGLLSILFMLAAASDRIPAALAAFANYYSVTSRLWEFSAGGMVAIFGQRLPLSSTVARIVGWTGLSMIISAFALLDDSQRYPGPWTLLPVTGAAAVIWAGEYSGATSSRLLSDRRLVWVGDRSYSLYLWHWPFVAFSLALWPTRWYAAGLATLAAFVPAILIYRWLENPIRRAPSPSRRRLFFMVLVFTSTPLIAGFLLIRSADTEAASRSGELPFKDLSLVTPGQECPPQVREALGPVGDRDIYCQSTGEPATLAVLGDSHAAMLSPGFTALDSQQGLISLGVAGAPFSDLRYEPIFRYVEESPTVNDVVLTSAWLFHGVDQERLPDELERLVAAGKRVHVLTDVPAFQGDSMRCAVRRLPVGDDICSIPVGEVRSQFSPILANLQDLNALVPQISVIDTSQYFCESGNCSMIFNGIPVYADSHHLNSAGAQLFVARLLTDSRELGSRFK